MHGELIQKDLATPSEEIHCIVRGTCLVIQKVKLWEIVPIKAYTKLTTSIHAEEGYIHVQRVLPVGVNVPFLRELAVPESS